MMIPSRSCWSCLLLPLIFFFSLVSATTEPLRYSFAYSPASSTSKPVPLGVLLATPITRNSPTQPETVITRLLWSLESYTAPRKESEAWARVGLLDRSGKAFNGSTTLVSIAALQQPNAHAAELYLQLDTDDLPESVNIRAVQEPKGKEANKDVGAPRLLIMTAVPEPKPILNKPVVLNAEGRVEEAPKEKTLLQKYWWVGAIMLAMTVMGGGDGK